jgi:hypothetical protein
MRALIIPVTIAFAVLASGCSHDEKTSASSMQDDAPAQPPPAASPHALPPDGQRVMHELARLSPENTLINLPRTATPPPRSKSLVEAQIDTWTQTSVADGYIRELQYDTNSRRFWIVEKGGFAGGIRWYGPLVMDEHGAIAALSLE